MGNRYTYDDLAKYFKAINQFTVFDIAYNNPVYGIIRERISGPYSWLETYHPVIKRN